MKTLRALAGLLRPHQWAKNILVLVPLGTSHQWSHPALWQSALLMLAAFSLTASAVYVINDARDAEDDRAHPEKCRRPFAARALSRWHVAWLVPLLLGGAALLAWSLPVAARVLLVVYASISLAYCLGLKRVLWLDVMTLAGLYVLRLAAGALAIGVEFSPWLLGFALFAFFSLAALKRYGDLRRHGDAVLAGRGYQLSDAPVLLTFGGAAAVASTVVLALYVQSPDVRRLYADAAVLHLAVPLVLYWLARLWTLAGRGQVSSDPILFALRDPPSYACGAILLLIVAGAL